MPEVLLGELRALAREERVYGVEVGKTLGDVVGHLLLHLVAHVHLRKGAKRARGILANSSIRA